MKKLPAYGKALADRLRFSNPPHLVVVCIGGDAWRLAKEWNRGCDVAALVLAPGQLPASLQWPVDGCFSLIEWGGGAGEQLIIDLIKCLLSAGSLSVTVRPNWVNEDDPIGHFESGVWVQTRECIRTYFPKKVVLNVA